MNLGARRGKGAVRIGRMYLVVKRWIERIISIKAVESILCNGI
jgi:hypothetical protein